MVNCLIIGHGAREHVIGESLVRGDATLYSFMSFKNAGLEDLSKEIKIHSETDFKEIVEFCKNKKIDFVVIGPEAPLCVGIVDAIEKNDIPCIGPKIEAAQLEGSKVFTRLLLEKYKIPSNVKSKMFDSMNSVENYIKDIDFGQGQIYVLAGKGGKDRTTILPKNISQRLQLYIEKVKLLHHMDLEQGFSEVYLPDSLARKYTNADRETCWQ